MFCLLLVKQQSVLFLQDGRVFRMMQCGVRYLALLILLENQALGNQLGNHEQATLGLSLPSWITAASLKVNINVTWGFC